MSGVQEVELDGTLKVLNLSRRRVGFRLAQVLDHLRCNESGQQGDDSEDNKHLDQGETLDIRSPGRDGLHVALLID